MPTRLHQKQDETTPRKGKKDKRKVRTMAPCSSQGFHTCASGKFSVVICGGDIQNETHDRNSHKTSTYVPNCYPLIKFVTTIRASIKTNKTLAPHKARTDTQKNIFALKMIQHDSIISAYVKCSLASTIGDRYGSPSERIVVTANDSRHRKKKSRTCKGQEHMSSGEQRK
jgi:hypothetical protein